MVLRKVVFVVWAIAFVPLFALLRSRLPVSPLYRTLIGSGVFWASAVAALWLLGRETQRVLRAWRTVFLLRMLIVVPLIVTIAIGLAEEGWPSGRMNRPIARLLVLLIIITVPPFLTGLGALTRSYRLTGLLALLAGLSSIVAGILLIQGGQRMREAPLRFTDLLGLVVAGARLETFVAIPLGVVLAVGGLLLLRRALARRKLRQAS